MINRIKTHNVLNGFVFSIVEYMIAGLAVAPFAGYYIVTSRFLFAAVAIGIILNCLVIAIIGIQQYRRHEKQVGIQHMFEKNVRERVGHEYPRLGNDTLVLSITVLLPFVILIWVIGEALLVNSRRGLL